MAGDMQASFIRTFVPLIVGVLVSFAARHGFDIDSDQAASALTAVFAFVFYAVVRYLETHRNSAFGWLLGSAKQPTYVSPPAVVVDADGERTVVDVEGQA
jgi:hypothetical protein